jgi:phage terminase small subunit
VTLTPRQQRFVAEYLVDLNGTQAAIRAGYSRNGAEVTASKLLRIAKVQRFVTAAQEERQTTTEVSADRVVRELAKIAFGFQKARDKTRALELLARYLGILRDRHEHSGTAGAPIKTVTRVVFGGRYRKDGSFEQGRFDMVGTPPAA